MRRRLLDAEPGSVGDNDDTTGRFQARLDNDCDGRPESLLDAVKRWDEDKEKAFVCVGCENPATRLDSHGDRLCEQCYHCGTAVAAFVCADCDGKTVADVDLLFTCVSCKGHRVRGVRQGGADDALEGWTCFEGPEEDPPDPDWAPGCSEQYHRGDLFVIFYPAGIKAGLWGAGRRSDGFSRPMFGDHSTKAEAMRAAVAALVDLEVHRNAPVPGVVDVLEQCLKAAKEGRMRSVAILGKRDDGGSITGYDCSEGGIAELLWSLERVKLQLLGQEIEDMIHDVIGL